MSKLAIERQAGSVNRTMLPRHVIHRIGMFLMFILVIATLVPQPAQAGYAFDNVELIAESVQVLKLQEGEDEIYLRAGQSSAYRPGYRMRDIRPVGINCIDYWRFTRPGQIKYIHESLGTMDTSAYKRLPYFSVLVELKEQDFLPHNLLGKIEFSYNNYHATVRHGGGYQSSFQRWIGNDRFQVLFYGANARYLVTFKYGILKNYGNPVGIPVCS